MSGRPTLVAGTDAADAGLPADLGPVEQVRAVGGGSIAVVRRVRCRNGTVVVKDTPYDATLEAEGLRALGDAGHPVPVVHAVQPDRLVLSDVSGPSRWAELGERLADGHLRTTGTAYGWERDNVLATLPQDNTAEQHWGRFVAERRTRVHLDAPGLSAATRRRCHAACDGPLPDLLGTGTGPVVVHGDLWTGNVVDGRALVDPAVFRGDREYDVAYLRVFGSPPAAFWDAYLATAPLADGWRPRIRALQMTAHLAHVRLFGDRWEGSVVADLDALGW